MKKLLSRLISLLLASCLLFQMSPAFAREEPAPDPAGVCQTETESAVETPEAAPDETPEASGGSLLPAEPQETPAAGSAQEPTAPPVPDNDLSEEPPAAPDVRAEGPAPVDSEYDTPSLIEGIKQTEKKDLEAAVRLGETVYYVQRSTYGSFVGIIYFSLPEETEITQLWNGTGEIYDLTKKDAVKKNTDGCTYVTLTKARVASVTDAKKHSFGGCFYFRLSGDDTVYTLIVDSKKFDTNVKFENSSRVSTGLYRYSGTDGIETLGSAYTMEDITDAALTSTFVRGTVTDTGIFCAGVKITSKPSTAANRQPDRCASWVMVNGERLPELRASMDGESRYSGPFSLQPGLNVVEVYSRISAVSSFSTGWDWFDHSKKTAQTVCAVYLLDYQGGPAEIPEPSGDATLNLPLTTAYQARPKDGSFREYPLIARDGGVLELYSIPSAYLEYSGTGSNSDAMGVVLRLVPNSPGATVRVEGPENLFAGSNGFLYGFNPCKAENAAFDIVVTAADGVTERTYPVRIIPASSDVDAEVTITNAQLMSETGAAVSFQPDVTAYYLQYFGGEAALTLDEDTENVKLDGVPLEGNTASLSPSKALHTLTFLAPDGVTSVNYYLLTKLPDGTVPYFTISSESKEQAKRMLSGYWDAMAQEEAKYFNNYWSVFQQFAVGSGVDETGAVIPYDFTGKSVYNVAEHGMKQATDAAACILELVLLGENPYDFPGYKYTFQKDENGKYVQNSGGGYLVESRTYTEHANYVELLQFFAGGPWANNQWYVMAAKAVGIDPKHTQNMKDKGLDSKHDLDMRAWAIAALNGLDGISRLDLVPYIESLHDAQMTDTSLNTADRKYKGLFQNNNLPGTLGPNSFTIGCTLTAIAAAGADPDRLFAYESTDGNTYYPLDQVEKYLWREADGKFLNGTSGHDLTYSYAKDMIIALGDILNGSNVWVRCQLTEEKYQALIEKANRAGVATGGMPAFGQGDYGRAYYDLYDAVFEATQDRSMRPDVIWGMPHQNFEGAVAELAEIMETSGITALALDEVKSAIDQYEALDDGNLKAVSQATLATYQAAVKAALAVKDPSGKSADAYQRIMALPDPSAAPMDSLRGEIEALLDACGLPKSGEDAFTPSAAQQAVQDNLKWAGASVLNKLIAARDKLGAPTIKINFALLGAPDDGENGTVHTYSKGNLQTWLPMETYELTNLEPTAEDVFRYVMDEVHHVQWEGDSNNSFGSLYVSGVRSPLNGTWMREFTTGPNSGWMYLVIEKGSEAGTYPNVGMTNWDLHDGDTMIFHYTDDYTLEDGGLEAKLRELTNLIRQLPNAGEITYDNYEDYIEDVEAIRALYDSLDKTIQAQVEKELIRKFEAVEAKVKFYLEIDKVKELLEGLPETCDTDSRPTERLTKRMDGIAAAYTRLDKEQQKYITAYDAQRYMEIRAWLIAGKFVKESDLPEIGSALLPEPVDGKVLLTPLGKMDEGGHASVKVEASVLNEALSIAKEESSVFSIAVHPAGAEDASSIAVDLPKNGLANIVDSGRFTLSIQTSQGRMDMVNGLLSELSGQVGNAGLTVGFAQSAPEHGAALLDGRGEVDADQLKRVSVTEVTLRSETADITTWGNKNLTLYLPVDTSQFLKDQTYTVYQISGDGSLEQHSGKCSNEEDGRFVRLNTSHLSTFIAVPAAKAPLSFTDVKPGDWFYDAAAYVTGRGLFTGVDSTTFAPGAPMTRSMLVTVLWRLEGEPVPAQGASFTDVPAGQWYTSAVTWASGAGVVTGTGGGFEPDGNVTREQIASILYRYAKIKGWDVTGSADLERFPDGWQTADWAARAMEWAFAKKLVTGKDSGFLDPQGQASRAEVAAILMRLLEG